ncbi:MAG: DUF4255 domain-containing protein [Chloroflexi bacterium]|nr:DUF4255 domain-containing protein [Chloroflexota bacterium]MBK6711054.1 DUF4255 domain-containing protein [Chloroflexota bacterium]MBK7177987.1 DUF4255 domain-containing protein [Chloroflexota bacterium]MBK7916071.1 DUF4255 domain-containing protein [Chloroflexota bacterium]MBK8930946.1 DUF4255 domain-containing protein [Chloroflexota bacterium]
MSEYTAVRAVSQTLKELVEAHVTDPTVQVFLTSPKEMQQNKQTGISIWLYRLTRNEFLLNQPRRRPANGQVARNPMPVNLHYLITPLMTDPRDEQMLLGLVLQVFNDHATVRGSDLKDALLGSDAELRLSFEAPSLEDLTRIWGALQEPYQASLTYLVQSITIESDHEPESSGLVMQRETTYTQILETGD